MYHSAGCIKHIASFIFLGVLCNAVSVQSTVFMHKPAAMGKDYYVVFPRNGDLVGNQNSATAALINSPVLQTIMITLPGPAHQQYHKVLTPGNARIHEDFGSILHVESNSEVVDVGGAARFQGTSPFNLIGQYGSPRILHQPIRLFPLPAGAKNTG